MKNKIKCPYCKRYIEVEIAAKEAEEISEAEKQRLAQQTTSHRTVPYERFREKLMELKKYKEKYGQLEAPKGVRATTPADISGYYTG